MDLRRRRGRCRRRPDRHLDPDAAWHGSTGRRTRRGAFRGSAITAGRAASTAAACTSVSGGATATATVRIIAAPPPPDKDGGTESGSDAIAAQVARATRAARAALAAGRIDDAAQAANQAIALDRTNREARDVLTRIAEVQRKRVDEALAALTAARTAATRANAQDLVPQLFAAADREEIGRPCISRIGTVHTCGRAHRYRGRAVPQCRGCGARRGRYASRARKGGG